MTPEQLKALETARNLTVARKLMEKSAEYCAQLTNANGRFTDAVEIASIELWVAIEDFTGLDEVTSVVTDLCFDAGIDREGYPLDEDGERCGLPRWTAPDARWMVRAGVR